MKVTVIVLLLIACITSINVINAEDALRSPQCIANYVKFFNETNEGKIFNKCFGVIMENSSAFCDYDYCRTHFSLPDEVISICREDPNDKELIEDVIYISKKMNEHVTKNCDKNSLPENKQDLMPNDTTPDVKPTSGSDSSSDSSNTSANTAGNNTSDNNTTDHNAAANNIAGNNTAGNITNVAASNSTNPAITNDTTLSAGSKLTYSLVTVFALAVFQILL